MTAENLYPHLNPQQYQAVTYLGGPLLVVAGAGSGKTGVITQKIAYLVKNAGYDAKNVFAVTFTNKAAREMAERSRKLLGKDGRGLTISTFHRLGLDMLHREYARIGLRKNFSIFDARDGITLLKELTKSEDDAQLRTVQSRISAFKNANIRPEQALQLQTDEAGQLAARAYHAYTERLQAYNAVDFDDLLLLPVQLLKTNMEVREYWQMRVRYLLIDEYQDTNDCQYQLLQLLSGASGAFTAVGDDDQSIYAWRGAQPQNLVHLQNDYPQLKTVKLEQNYRCHQKILAAANQLIANNSHIVEKRLWSTLTAGDGIIVTSARNEEDEAELIVRDIHFNQIRRRAQPKDFAILYRSNFQSRLLEQHLREHNIPYKISGGTSFYEHSEIRDLLSYLRLINNPDDDAAFLRVVNTPKRGIGPAALTQLGQYAARRGRPLAACAQEVGFAQEIGAGAYKHLGEFSRWLAAIQRTADASTPAQLLNRIIEDIEYEDYLYELHKEPRKVEKRQERIGQLQAWITRLEEENELTRLDSLMQHLMLMDILDRQEKDVNAVQLMTLHSAKGLEFPHVYIVGCEEGLLPHANSAETDDGIAEERRLMYVGMTRAKENLTISYAKARRKGGQWQTSEPSRFLDELPEDGIDWQDGRAKPDPEAAAQKVKDGFAAIWDMLGGAPDA